MTQSERWKCWNRGPVVEDVVNGSGSNLFSKGERP
jgi:hypothetical protein